MAERSSDYFKGCLLGGAVGDALGAPIEFLSLDRIYNDYGPQGLCDYAKAYGKEGAITDDTQLTLFTAEGLILSTIRKEYRSSNGTVESVYHAYLRWLYTQQQSIHKELIKNFGTCAIVDGFLTAHPQMFSRRAPGNSCLSALASGKMGSMNKPINNSKGCGGVMRMAPVGLFCRDAATAFRIGCDCAAVTHGHPSGFLSAGFLAALIFHIGSGVSLSKAIENSLSILKQYSNGDEVFHSITNALQLSQSSLPQIDAIRHLGAGWVAEEALAISLYCSLTWKDSFSKAVLSAVNHDGDSDSTGAITGNILGALHGIEKIPLNWRRKLELYQVIEEVAMDLYQCSIT
jgi:ADP-ribosylglycohydrolase